MSDPQIDTTEGTGYDWLNRFMEAQASVMANSLFFTFKLGQIGAASRAGAKELAREMLADLRTDRDDLQEADANLIGVVDGLIANIERNLA